MVTPRRLMNCRQKKAQKFVEYMGGADAILQKATQDYDRVISAGLPKLLVRWCLPIQTTGQRDLEADALEQLGYQAESGPWRNFYLTGAQELRNGVQNYQHQILPAQTPCVR